MSAPSSDRDCRETQRGWRHGWSTPKLIDVSRFPHGVPQFCRNISTSWRAQEPPRRNLLARGVDFGGRGEVTGDVVIPGVKFVDEGGKNTARAKKGGYP